MMRYAVISGLLVVLNAAVSAQSLTQSPRFDVASVRTVSAANGRPTGFALNPRRASDRLTWTTTLYSLILYAYDLPAWRVSGIQPEPSYLTIAATMNAAAMPDDVRSMLRQLLIDRFKLVTHTKIDERSGYELVVGKNGPKLGTATKDGTPPPMPDYMKAQSAAVFEGFIVTSMEGIGIAAITGRGVPLSKLADELSQQFSRPVFDRTGLKGKYYFGFTFQQLDVLTADAPNAPSVFDAVQDQLGLKLNSATGPVEFLVVDSVEKNPTEN